ncbi:DUF5348 domain-containing protein [Pullulanibacillus sp. KACC 23026]|uniref:DUF5348 domain-containing protein n=1 Tax=Pullulanibacillus sp. KACC 23026 TaxID=3028315 RepID=UPI0023AFDCB1|nr:DUF5348 domain-containing protein [Pullulanibacillus sp. KACC 23026]WEG14838.1 DUF5348 domain-containing protein [Pullulanibacillus sp. KACC 23026]
MSSPTPSDVLNQLVSMKDEIKEVLESIHFGPDQNLNVNFADPNDIFLNNECGYIISKLEDIHHQLNYLSHPIIEEGTLYKRPNGRYAISDKYEFTTGSLIEVLVHNHEDDHESWVETRIEEQNGDYYFHHIKDLPLEGAHVRRRAYV